VYRLLCTQSQNISKSIDTLLGNLENRDSIHHLQYPATLSDSMFYDPFHPTRELSIIFNKWLSSELQSIFEK